MNREETKELIKVMQAYVDGEVVEFINQYCKWQQIGDHHNWGSRTQYRIKPKPRIIWVYYPAKGDLAAYSSRPNGSGYIPYRELTPEEREELKI